MDQLAEAHHRRVTASPAGLRPWPAPSDTVTATPSISPIEWDTVILYGQYVMDRGQVR